MLAVPAAPPPAKSYVEVWSQAARRDETLHPPLRLFRRPRRPADTLPPPSGMLPPLSTTATRMGAGRLRTGTSRRVDTPLGTMYLVPTARGWICTQTPHVTTCHRGLLPQRVTWGFWSTDDGIDVVGVAANDVRRVTLVWPGHTRRARLNDNVFAVSRPVRLNSTKLPRLGRLRVDYRDRPSEVVPLR